MTEPTFGIPNDPPLPKVEIPSTEESLASILLRHTGMVEHDGDGYNEPYTCRYICSCGVVYQEWTQKDPEQSDYSEWCYEAADNSRRMHANHVSGIITPVIERGTLLAAADAIDKLADSIPPYLDMSTPYRWEHGSTVTVRRFLQDAASDLRKP